MLSLNTSVSSLRMVGPAYVLRLKKLGIETVEDLLYHFPFRYEDYSIVSKINLLQAGETVTVVGKINSTKNVYTKYGKKIQTAQISDETGEIEAVWYNQPFLTKILKPGTTVTVAGEVKWFVDKLVFESPDYEIIKPTTNPSPPLGASNPQPTTNLIHTGRLVPIYPETAGISSKWLRSRIAIVLYKLTPQIDEFLPQTLIQRFHLLDERQAFYQMHFPKDYQQAEIAKYRLSFDEFLILQMAAQIRKRTWQEEKVVYKYQISAFDEQIQHFINQLPFKLTVSQQKAVSDILSDLVSDRPMNRLLEGDVGSGKTVVAAIAMYATFLNGYQSALMAPTEILARQHFETIRKLFSKFGIKIALMTGKCKSSGKKFDVFVGTHALLSDKMLFSKLGLVVIDEQQRFGVEQRAVLRSKGNNPHLLTMTATPIPRTIALSLYADLDLSILDEMPAGRKIVRTWVVPPEKRSAAYMWIKKQILSTRPHPQAFVICPLIEESESLTAVKAVKAEYERLKKEIFPDMKLGLLHGKLKSKEKNQVLSDFKNNKLNILVATPVVEVGIDIPYATIMLIDDADRFGLAQLHQLRGRVGRSNLQSYCLLFSETGSEKTLKRLLLLETNFSGPRLAELDLKLRGGGDIFGTRQHGQMTLKIADISDTPLIEKTKEAVNRIFSLDSTLTGFPLLRKRLQKYTIKKIAPD